MAAVDYFLKINGIEGESADAKHKAEIDLESWSWGAQNSGGHSYGGGGGTGVVTMQDFHFTMKVNKATPKLIEKCATGEHIPDAILTCRKAGTEQQEYLKYYFYDLLISSYSTGGSGGADMIPTEQVAFNYAKVKVEYSEQDKAGKLKGPVFAGWDLKAKQKV